LENAVSDGEERAAMGANDHFKCLSIAVNGRLVLFAFTGIHCVDLKPRRSTARICANFFQEKSREGGSASPEDDGKQIAEGANTRRQSRNIYQRVADNAFHLKNEDCIPDTD
jgi:hypothetical protein